MTGKGHSLHRNDRLDPPLTASGLVDDENMKEKASAANVWVPFLISLSIHLGIGWWLFIPREPEAPASRPEAEAIVLRLVPSNPLVSEMPSDSPVEPEISDVTPEVEPEPSSPPRPSPPLSPPSPSAGPIVEVPTVRDSSPTPDTSPTIQTPSVLTLRQIVEETASRQEQRNSGFDCSPLQLENEMLNCNNRLDEFFENTPDSNSTVEFFNRAATPGRFQNAARMTSAGVEEIGANLRAAGISNISIERLMNQLESIAKEYAAPENEKTRILQDEMLRNDPVWQQRNRAMNPR